MSHLTLRRLSETFAIHSLRRDSSIPDVVFTAPIFFLAKTYDEISIVLPEHIEIDSEDAELGWQAFEVVGPLDFSLTGISLCGLVAIALNLILPQAKPDEESLAQEQAIAKDLVDHGKEK